ncbi:FG-GAP repeat domain-containing protein [Pseudobacteriovorax antillogorgiicola]|uniref:Repeat domain-containing protein n=1 Tax=Pseudobacteriovorax antillogorgiicola TaxID=1513793 RepID=A0A1Y6BMA1_9BACT|nr:VCBS repeat-containing protein [Pseudobacteriovorax antillogorgiicola]TCS54540.1 VCBS repeat protein [Pseudobacteriovorax antillogorgiicola]SMF18602.1 Repeat domain-containing protein [Pseudobacteriovorax antillogorgiicola]
MKNYKTLVIVFLIFLFSGAFCKRTQESSVSNSPQSLFNDASQLLPEEARYRMCMDAQSIDLDQDGDMDLILAIEFGENILLINDGSGTFAIDQSFPKSKRDSEDIAAADFNLDEAIDIIIVTEDDQINESYLSNSVGKFDRREDNISDHGITNGVAFSDFDNKLGPDLVFANKGENFLLLNDGKANFKKVFLNDNTDTSQDVELGDLDGDGDLDIVIANEGKNQMLINQGQLKFQDESETRLAGGFPLTETRDIDLFDIDGDGDLDIFTGNVRLFHKYDAQNRIYINDGNGFFTEETGNRLPTDSLNTFDGDFFDFDRDGDSDLVTANGNLWANAGRTYTFLANDGNGKFTVLEDESVPRVQGVDGFDVEFADFNNDGLGDLYFCSRGRKDGGNTDYLFIGRPSSQFPGK